MAAKLSLRPVLGYLHQFCDNASRTEATDRRLLELFVHNGDQDAFRTIVRRHGPLVLGVALRALRHRQDAEDCFQATFLVLARKANAVAWEESIAPWLHQVATRLGAELRTRAARQRLREQSAAFDVAVQPKDDVGLRDLAAAVDDELQRLPERLRGPMLLCCLQGQTRDQAAHSLGLSLRTLERRLHDGRRRLEANLLRRGITLSAALAAWGLTRGAAVASELIAGTVAAAHQFATGAVSSTAAALATQALRSMAWEKVRWALGVLTAVGLCITGLGLSAISPTNSPTAEAHAAPERAQQPKNPVAGANKVQEIGTATAVQSGLRWLVKQQVADGSWRFDGAVANDIAATGLALLPLLEANDAAHKDAIRRGLAFLVSRQKADGSMDSSMYANAMAAWALCDGYRVTGDPKLKAPTQQAIDFIVRAQSAGGGWRYAPNQPGDTSVTAWHIIALKQGERAGIKVPAEAFTKASKFLDSVALDQGSAYGYTPHAQASASMSAGGLYCRQLLGWHKEKAELQKGAINLQKSAPNTNLANIYYYHFATRAMHGIGGPAWLTWEDRMASLLREKQDHGGATDGSWPAGNDVYGAAGGRMLVTSLSVLTLQSCGQFEIGAAPRELTDAEVANHWTDLRDDSLAKIRPALQGLVNSPDTTLPMLRMQLRPSKAGDPKQLEPLVAELGSSVFGKRTRAFEQLKAVGEPAVPSLRKALKSNPDLEHRRRIESLLELATAQPVSPDRLRELRGVQILELIGTPEARRLLEELSNGAPGIGLTQPAADSLDRLRQR